MVDPKTVDVETIIANKTLLVNYCQFKQVVGRCRYERRDRRYREKEPSGRGSASRGLDRADSDPLRRHWPPAGGTDCRRAAAAALVRGAGNPRPRPRPAA